MHPFKAILVSGIFGIFATSYTNAQETPPVSGEVAFASENAILDTSILFSIGAQEARQELRGAFGWPTFQEGLVEGVYFRFDPDGYARFAPSPRLDSDVFEVICRPRTFVCMGRKDNMQISLNSRGQVQLELPSIAENDSFILADGISELPLPPTILQPLEPRLELLLSVGGELIVRRQQNEVYRISLAGFSAVVPYLRWVAARQDYTVLPRGWPVPNALKGQESAGLTQTTMWQSPMPQPHVVTQVQSAALNPNPPMDTHNPQVGTDVAEVRGELNILREILLDRQAESTTPPAPAAPSALPAPIGVPSPNDPIALQARVNQLLQMANELQQELNRVHGTVTAPPVPPAKNQPVADEVTSGQNSATENKRDVARHLDYLMTEVGLAPDVALMVVQQAQQSDQAASDVAKTEHNQVINDILAELRTQLPSDEAQSPKSDTPQSNTEYQLLTDYFNSVTQE